MFSALRQGNQFYILDKSDNTLKFGQVLSVSNPVPKYGGSYIQTQSFDTVVDISVKVGDSTMEFKQVPSGLSIANFGSGGIVISESREAMIAEVEGMLRASRAVLESVPQHNKTVEVCESMMNLLNPSLAKEKAQEEKISQLEDKMNSIEKSLGNMTDMLAKALNTSKKEKTQ